MVEAVSTKRCRVCGGEKPLTEMSRRSSRKDGCDTICLACNRLRVIKWNKDNPEKKNAKQRRWEAAHPEYGREKRQRNPQKHRDAVRQWRLKHQEKAREKDRKWRLKNTEKERERKLRWYSEHREEMLKRQFQWRNTHREQVRASRQRSEQGNLEAGRIRKHRRRAQKKGNGGTFSVQEWQALKAKYDHRCLACHRSEPEIQLHQDHIIPIDKGGMNTIDNIQPLCRECNSRKGTKIIDYRPIKD
ncbi:MAG: HNH endonuclease [Anaerolineae bacterium]|nr:HNH endonuclease [Anaerolineae bacterium]